MNQLDDMISDLKRLYSIYREQPESAEVIAEHISVLEEQLMMHYDINYIYNLLEAV